MPLQELIDAARRENAATSYFKKHTRDIAQGVSPSAIWIETHVVTHRGPHRGPLRMADTGYDPWRH